MTFDLDQLRSLTDRGPVARVVIASVQGSAPREVGAAMIVTDTETLGTIGGGALELEAIKNARSSLSSGVDRLDRVALGPALAQCCGGAVTVVTEVWNSNRLVTIDSDVVARPLPEGNRVIPLSVSRVLLKSRNSGDVPRAGIVDGWMIEPITKANRSIWVWGAGHVGRALVAVLSPIPEITISWVDNDRTRFPETISERVQVLIAENPADLVSVSPPTAEHFVLTFSHALDLEICHRVLSGPFESLGLIGSATKRARFRSRLAALGHGTAQINRMICPIGDPKTGKHPHAIALGVAAGLLSHEAQGKVRGKDLA